MGKWQKSPKFIYVGREEIAYPPGFAPFVGDIAHFAHFRGILAHFAFHNWQKWGDKSFMLLARTIYSPLPCGSIWSFFHGFRFIHLYQSYSCRAACQVLDKSNLSQLRASSKLIPSTWQQSSLSSLSDIHYIPRTINAYLDIISMFRYCVRDALPWPKEASQKWSSINFETTKNSLKIIKSLWNVLEVVLWYFVENFVQILYQPFVDMFCEMKPDLNAT